MSGPLQGFMGVVGIQVKWAKVRKERLGADDEFVREAGRLMGGKLGLCWLAGLENGEYPNRYYTPEIRGLS